MVMNGCLWCFNTILCVLKKTFFFCIYECIWLLVFPSVVHFCWASFPLKKKKKRSWFVPFHKLYVKNIQSKDIYCILMNPSWPSIRCLFVRAVCCFKFEHGKYFKNHDFISFKWTSCSGYLLSQAPTVSELCFGFYYCYFSQIRSGCASWTFDGGKVRLSWSLSSSVDWQMGV